MVRDLPTGVVTLPFTDVEASSPLRNAARRPRELRSGGSGATELETSATAGATGWFA
jgi:hypothetical protein